MNQKKAAKRGAGFALLEVLIALVVLAFGMIGIAGMLLVAHKANSSSYLKQQAVQSAYDIIDRVRLTVRLLSAVAMMSTICSPAR